MFTSIVFMLSWTGYTGYSHLSSDINCATLRIAITSGLNVLFIKLSAVVTVDYLLYAPNFTQT